MNRPLQSFLVVVLACLCFASGAWYASSRPTRAMSSGTRRVLYYHDPMHPAYRSDHPGTAPDCGMDLEPVYDDASPSTSPGPPGTVHISSDKQQLMGIRTYPAEKSAGPQTLRTVGRVAVDESRVYRLISAVDGWIINIYPKAPGSRVQKNEPLLSFYGREFLGAEQAYFYSIDSLDRLRQAGPVSEAQMATSQAQIRQNKDALLTMGMGERQIAEIASTRKLTQEILLTAPVDGYILARNVSPGLRFDRGLEFYRVADLSRVWITADVYEGDARLSTAAAARVIWRGRTFPARWTDSAPQFDGTSRTLRVRFEALNPDALLRPDMFVDVEIPTRLSEALTVPADAVVESGRRTLVYVDRGDGSFEPRPVQTGWRSGDRVAITSGLAAGERVVAEGNFLLDSESRLRQAASFSSAQHAEPAASEIQAGPALQEKDPVCGMTVKAATWTSQTGGHTYRFCSQKCKRDFDANQAMYAERGAS